MRLRPAPLPLLWLAMPMLVSPSMVRPQTLDWAPEPGLAEVDGVQAVATDPASGRAALGDEGGVVWLEPGRSPLRVLRRGPVNDLHFRDGTLLMATGRGLFIRFASGSVVDGSPAPGSRARDVRRIAVAGDAVAVATADGAHLTNDLRAWRRLDGGLPGGSVESVLLLRDAVWMVAGGEVWHAARDPREAVTGARQVTFEGGAPLRDAIDLVAGIPGASLVVVGRRSLVVREAGGSAWRVLRPAIPPGAELRRLRAGDGRLWLATSRGLLVARSLEGPWERAAPPAGETGCFDLAPAADGWWLASAAGLLVGKAGARRARSAASTVADRDPPIGELHRAVLHHQELSPGFVRELRRGVRRRGLLPTVDVDLAYGGDRKRGLDVDEAFTSGEYRVFRDRDRDRSRDFVIGLTLSWDLGDLAYHPESIDVSREAREVVELRDDVLDEVNHLYHERRRVLSEAGSAGPGEAARLRARADELRAGLDAWSGGWFSRQLQP